MKLEFRNGELSVKNLELLSNGAIPFLKAKAIYMGCKMQGELRRALVKFAEVNGIPVFRAVQSNERFELAFSSQSLNGLREEEFYDKLTRFNMLQDEARRGRLISRLYEDQALDRESDKNRRPATRRN
jgi:hypothetical protein